MTKGIRPRLLKALRDASGRTQGEVAEAIGVFQSAISRLERRNDDHLVSTLEGYVHALGGRLEIYAVFKDRKVRISG